MAKLTFEMAEKIGKGAVARAQELGIKITVAVCDDSGILVYLAKMDGTGFLTPKTSFGKAYLSAALKRSSADLAKAALDRPPFFNSVVAISGGVAVLGQGGLPIVVDGQVIGAVGAGGGTSEQDEDVSRAGLQVAGVA